jgi:hypothetical protein
MASGTGHRATPPSVALPAQYTSVEQYLGALQHFIETHAWLFCHHVADFITQDHWQHMPAAWCAPLLECSTSELLCLPVGVCPVDAAERGWPEALTAFISDASALALPRVPAREAAAEAAAAAASQPQPQPEPEPEPEPESEPTTSAADLLCGLGSEQGMEISARKGSTPLSKALSRGMKLKKRHEVERLAALVASLCERLGCKTVVDFGAGQGYLGQVLHFGYGLRVVAIDSSSHQTHGADRRLQRVQKALSRRPTAAAAPPLPEQRTTRDTDASLIGDGVQSVTCLLDQNLTTLPALLNSAECAPPSSSSNDHEYGEGPGAGGFLLLGLHTCGDLTPSMLRVFGNREAWALVGKAKGEGSLESAPASWGQPAGIVNVGCCYHLLSELEDSGGSSDDNTATGMLPGLTRGQAEVAGAVPTELGFPLSRSVAALGLQLGLSGRMLACQAVERWPTKGEALDALKTNVGGKWVAKEGVAAVGAEPGCRRAGMSDLPLAKNGRLGAAAERSRAARRDCAGHDDTTELQGMRH